MDALLQKATGFAATVTGTNVFDYVAVFQTYDILDASGIPQPDRRAEPAGRDKALGMYKLKYTKVRDSVQYVLDNPDEFESVRLAGPDSQTEWAERLPQQAERCGVVVLQRPDEMPVPDLSRQPRLDPTAAA